MCASAVVVTVDPSGCVGIDATCCGCDGNTSEDALLFGL